MIAAPAQSVSFLRGRLKPVPAVDGGQIQRWIVDLGSDQFKVRDAALKQLHKAGEQVQMPIELAIKADPPLEMRRRLKQILEAANVSPGPETVRTIRAIMVLERIGSTEAQAVLETLARGAPGTRATEEAGAALKRLGNRIAQTP